MKEKCTIFAAGDYHGTNFNKNDFSLIIAADAGFHHLEKMNVSPDILIGDFDTIGTLPPHDCIIPFPPEKDYTDTELALMEGIKRGYTDFTIYGAIGGKRLEHTLANISLAASYSKKGYSITLSDGYTFVTALTDGTLTFDKSNSGFISVFPFMAEAVGVTIRGLKYELTNAVLNSENPTLCVSNEFIGQAAEISVENGTLIIILNHPS